MEKNILYDFNTHLRERFGCRVQRICIDAGLTCPNRDGAISCGGCTFCGAEGSGRGALAGNIPIAQQISDGKVFAARRYKAGKFLAYFQSFTNTYAPCSTLCRYYTEALSDPDMVGLCIGTRPDCIDEEKLDMIAAFTPDYLVWLEYGLQSMHNRTLKAINRGHTFEDFVHAVKLTRGRGIYVCAHVILGLPGESREDILQTAGAIADLQIDGIKIHSLYILEGTPMATLYRQRKYICLSRDGYVELVVDFLSRLPPDIIIHRLTGDPDRSLLVAPDWTLGKQETLNRIYDALRARPKITSHFHASIHPAWPRCSSVK
jgi:radical SAM protein (TIGR01212 family)